MSQIFEVNYMGCGNFSSVSEEFNEYKGKSCDNLNRGSERLTGVNDAQEIEGESQQAIEENEKSEKKVNPISIDGFNLLRQINPQSCNEKDLLGKKRVLPKFKNDEVINSFYYVTNIVNNKSKKSRFSSNIVMNPEGKTSPHTLNLEEEDIEKNYIINKFNKDNYIKACLKSPYSWLVKLIEKYGGIKLARVNLKNVFGGTTQNKISLERKLYQIICFDEKNKKILINAKPNDEKIFNYFLSSEYKFLLNKYYDNDNNKNKTFNIDGKDVKIEDFKTFEEVKKIKKIKYYSDENIGNFRSAVSIVLNNFEGYEERKPKKEGGCMTKFEYIKKFENIEEGNEDNKSFSEFLILSENEESINHEHMPRNGQNLLPMNFIINNNNDFRNINDIDINGKNIFNSCDSNENNNLNNGVILNKSDCLNISRESIDESSFHGIKSDKNISQENEFIGPENNSLRRANSYDNLFSLDNSFLNYDIFS